MYLSIDFETRSTVDLRRSGVYVYADDPTTDVWCMAYAFGDRPVEVWIPGDPLPKYFKKWIDQGHPLRAHNAQFERIIWREILGPRYGFPVPQMEQWFCTAAETAAMALPRSLKGAGVALGLETKKDDSARRLMLQMAKPRRIEDDGSITWWDDAERLARLIDYCMQDVRAERALARVVRPLTYTERRVYLLDQTANDRGVRLDRPLIDAAKTVVTIGSNRADQQILTLTDGAANTVNSTGAIVDWCRNQGYDLPDLTKSTVRDVLALENGEVPDQVRQVLEVRAEAAKSSNAKLDAMIRCACSDGRARGLLMYHGASTGRWAGRLIQPQNFPRGEISDAEDYIEHVMATVSEGDYDELARLTPPLDTVSSLLRGMLVASPGHRLIAGDYSQIEARTLGWMAGEPYEDNAYERMGAAIYGIPVEEVTKDSFERFVGKTTVLGAGYQMGKDRYKSQLWDQFGVDVSEEIAEKAIQTYRAGKPGIPVFWNAIESAAMRAVRKPGTIQEVGVGNVLRWTMRGPYLWCILPSGRPLCYPAPRIHPTVTPWGAQKDSLQYLTVLSPSNRWGRKTAYGGLLTENVIQAIARDLMAHAMLALEEAGYPVILTVHDEVVCDVPEGQGSTEKFNSIMVNIPAWAKGCPVEAGVWEGPRYRKD